MESVAAFLRDRFGGAASGSSVGLCGVFAAYCLMNPGARLLLFLPVPLKAAHGLWSALAIAVLLVVIPTDPDLAHLAHLGGLLSGVALARLWPART